MQKRVINIVFSGMFILMIVIPLLTTNLKDNVISEAENRYLTAKAKLHNEDGSINPHFTTDFEAWANDNIGFRSQMVIANARLQYYLFKVLANNTDTYLGPDGELNYATDEMISDYQHNNLYEEDYLTQYAEGMQILCDYANNRGAQFFYYQCWDKHSIYPEYFPRTVLQHGSVSKTDGLFNSLRDKTSVTAISPKDELIYAKREYEPYSVCGDPTHWTQRGAYIGYLKLMATINECSDIQFFVLKEDNYEISIVDQGNTLFGGIHLPDELEKFTLLSPKAVLTNEKLTINRDEKRSRFYTNDYADNDTRMLIIGDSYFANFLIDDLAESFHEVVFVHADYLWNARNIIDEYNPDIVLVEAAERVDRSGYLIELANE